MVTDSLAEDGLKEWLLAGDPSIRWQVMQHLIGSPPAQVAAERERVGTEGWGARLLAAQDADGLWAGALYSPKWTSTTYTLLLLRQLGLAPSNSQARHGCERLWEAASDYEGGLNFAKSIREPETCITGMLVLLATTFGCAEGRVDRTVNWLLNEQLADGGWNCETIRSGSNHGSFHTSITVMEALLAYQEAGEIPVKAALAKGEEFFLRHRLFKSHRTAQVADETFTRFPFPPQWHFDVLRGLEYFHSVSATHDDRLQDAVDLVRNARRTDGSWHRHRPYPGRTWFQMEPAGPSRWTTLRCLRVLSWWDGTPPLPDQ
ncbi:hypothetical protein [Aeromicrobium sp.]|uniref:hypothetical protein n=1 Tax=Aeromicrobium sp. TaxID=1871063 RepID=UPI002FC838C3